VLDAVQTTVGAIDVFAFGVNNGYNPVKHPVAYTAELNHTHVDVFAGH